MNITWDAFAEFVTKFIDFIKTLLTALGEWPLDLGIDLGDEEADA